VHDAGDPRAAHPLDRLVVEAIIAHTACSAALTLAEAVKRRAERTPN
jgi:cob(I)alamin adenosyltransferase